MKKRLLLTFVMMATWMVVGCTTNFTNTDGRGCYGYWESNYWGLKRGTLLKNQNYSKVF